MTNLAEAIQNACEIARQDERKKLRESLSNTVKAYKCRGEAFFDREIAAIEKIINELFGGE